MKAAIRTLEARANGEGQQYEIALRVAQHDGCVYLNLPRDDGSIVEVSPSGWRIVRDAPVRFWRAPAMQPLSLPMRKIIESAQPFSSKMHSRFHRRCTPIFMTVHTQGAVLRAHARVDIGV